MKKKIKKKYLGILVGLIFGLVLIYQGFNQPVVSSVLQPAKVLPSMPVATTSASPAGIAINLPGGWVQAQVARVVDGDTLEVIIKGQNFKLRYIGVNTPETVDPRRPVQCFGKEASEENKKLLPPGETVFLEKDLSDTDKYDRLLRYVYLRLDDGNYLMVNDYLVRQGFAQVNTYPPDVKYVTRFTQAQTEARTQNRGLWSKCQNQ